MIIYVLHIILIFKVMHFVFFISLFLTEEEKFFYFPYTEHTFLDCKQYVGAGMDILMSISDGLGPSIFLSKMEKARPMREEMDGNVVYSPSESAFLTLML